MKIKNVLLFIILLIISSKSYATDQWLVFGAGSYDVKSKYDPPPFRKWHKTTIGYTISSAPSGLGYLIDRSFDTWEACVYLSFTSGSDITVQTVSGEHSWFGYGPSTCNSKGEITSAMVQLNGGTCLGYQVNWTDGNEDSDNPPWYCDVQNCVTHELGHNLGIAHHSTGNGEPTMATREQCPSFNTTLKRRTLETDDWEALDFLYQNAFVPEEYSTISSALNMINQIGEGKVTVSSGTYTVSNNLTVSAGVTLQINAGATVNFTGSYKLLVYGTLTISGSSGQHVIINGQGYLRSSMSNAMIVVQSGGTANIQYADFKYAAYQLTFWQNSGSSTVQNCTFTNFGYASESKAVSAYYSIGAVTISNSTFTGSGSKGMGVYATNTGTNVTISGNSFNNCRVGVRCYSSNAFITSNTIQNGYYYGIQSDNVATSAQYRDNTICNNG